MNPTPGATEIPAWLRYTIDALAERGDMDGIRQIVGAYLISEFWIAVEAHR